MDDGPEKDVRVFGAGDGVEGTVVGDDVHGGDCGGQVAVIAAGAVGGGSAGSGDCDVGERREVAEGEAPLVDVRSELAVGDTCSDGDSAGGGVEVDLVEML